MRLLFAEMLFVLLALGGIFFRMKPCRNVAFAVCKVCVRINDGSSAQNQIYPQTQRNLNLLQAANLEIKIISVELKVELEVHRGGGAFDWDEGHMTNFT